MKMHILSGGRLRMEKRIYVPGAALGETFELPVSCFLFRHAHGNLLFDTGCHPNVAENPEALWGEMARSVVPVMAAGDNVLSALTRVNLAPEDIDIVVNSHPHCDHCGCNEFYSNATIYVHAAELACARDPASEGQGYFRAEWDHPLPTVEFTGEVDIFDDGRLVLLPLPGHTPGLTGLLAQLPNSGAYLLASDAAAIAKNLDAEIVSQNIWNRDLNLQSVAEIKRIGKSGAAIIHGHDLAQSIAFKAAEESYD